MNRYLVARVHAQSGHVSTFLMNASADSDALIERWNRNRHASYMWRYAVLGTVEVAS